MNCKFDIHLNLEQFPTSRNSDTKIYSSVDDLAEFIKRNEIGAAVTLYPRDGYHYMEQLAQKTPDVTHYGVQVLMGVDENDATDIKALKIDASDSSKVYCKGIKIASHRGWWNRDGKIDSGLDYGKESNKIHKWLKQLPDGAVTRLSGSKCIECIPLLSMIQNKSILIAPIAFFVPVIQCHGQVAFRACCRPFRVFYFKLFE